ncbi:MAG: hypothetical protein QOI31_2440 [Solirubrobacterales bacterium]|jgi:hypothetical protein|nr:hypothetical protein [Solirubrobacterales bacterium]
MPEVIVGPMLRYADETQATVWVETDEACEVEVLGFTEPTFCVEGHHYALVCIHDLEPGSENAYEVNLDGELAWPDPDSELPPPCIRTISEDTELRVSFGSCRMAVPHEAPHTHSQDEHDEGREVDALHVLAKELIRDPKSRWPNLLLLLGDQVYVDEGSPKTREFIRSRRDTSKEPGEEVLDFEEYTHLYRESWTDPLVRWLFSTIPTAMVIDDHDMSDDWNISRTWVEEMEQKEWWQKRLVAGFSTYWLYQHMGNLSPSELSEDRTWNEARENRDDATEVVMDYANRAHNNRDGIRWSFYRDLCRTRVIVMDNRGGRVLEKDRRSIFDDEERDWVWDKAKGDFDHLLIGASDPFLLTHSFHWLEAWNEKVVEGKAWGSSGSKLGEKMRRSVDFDHWSAFGFSFKKMTEFLRRAGSGEWGEPPATIVICSGDVHHAYLAEVAFPRSAGVKSAVYQAVCSPFRNPLDSTERRVIRLATTKPVEALTRALAKSAGVPDPDLRWRFAEGPYFDNQVATIHIEGRKSEIKLEKTKPGETEEESLETTFERRLA